MSWRILAVVWIVLLVVTGEPWERASALVAVVFLALSTEATSIAARRRETARREASPTPRQARAVRTIWTRLAGDFAQAMVPAIRSAAQAARRAQESFAAVFANLPNPTKRCYCGAIVERGTTAPHDHVLRMVGAIPPDPMRHDEAVREAVTWAVGWTSLAWPVGLSAQDADTIADYVIEHAITPEDGLAKVREMITDHRPEVVRLMVDAVWRMDVFDETMNDIRESLGVDGNDLDQLGRDATEVGR